MKMNLLLFSIMMIFSGLLSAGEALPETDKEAVLTVHIDNGTAGGHVEQGTPVTVNFYQDEELIRQESSETDSDGNCIIKDLPKGTDIIAMAQARHGDMAFSSSPLQLIPDKQLYELSVHVFDVDYDNSHIRIGMHHLIITKSANGIHVAEYIQLINDSDRAILSNKKDAKNRPRVIEIALPKNFKSLSFSSYFHPEAVVETPTGFCDTMAIPPGSYHAVFSYDIPVKSGSMEFEKPITLPTDKLMVFIQVPTVTVTGLGEPAGRMVLKDAPTDYYTVDVSQGSVLKFHLEGIWVRKPQENIWIILGIVFAVVVLVAIFRLRKS